MVTNSLRIPVKACAVMRVVAFNQSLWVISTNADLISPASRVIENTGLTFHNTSTEEGVCLLDCHFILA
jgi:hypothetical protein